MAFPSSSRICLLCLCVCPGLAAAQQHRAEPRLAIHVGFGNYYGWVGTAGEGYIVPGRLSVFGGIGVAPRRWFSVSSTLWNGAGGVRFYAPLGSSGHRLFADLSVSLLEVSEALTIPGQISKDYGPGFSIGYSYLSHSGFTVTAGAGAGKGNFDTIAVLHVGVGWTWRH